MGKKTPWGLEAKPGQVGNTAVLEGEKEEEKGKIGTCRGAEGRVAEKQREEGSRGQ